MLAGMEALKIYMVNQDPAEAAKLVNKEKEADEARRILIYELNRTSVHPSIGRIFLHYRARLTV